MSKNPLEESVLNSSSKIAFETILRPLEEIGDRASSEYVQQLRDLKSVDAKFRNVEAFYANSFTRVLELENRVTEILSSWDEKTSELQEETA